MKCNCRCTFLTFGVVDIIPCVCSWFFLSLFEFYFIHFFHDFILRIWFFIRLFQHNCPEVPILNENAAEDKNALNVDR